VRISVPFLPIDAVGYLSCPCFSYGVSREIVVQRTEIQVNLGERSYPIVVTSGELAGVGAFARSRAQGTQAAIVCDENTRRPLAETVAKSLTDAGFSAVIASVAPGEETKSLDAAATLYERLIDMAADRRTLVVAVGGGVVGDLAGFVAATYARGVPFLQVPTSLLAQVDSSVGGKVGVNFHTPDGRITKNMIGAFHQPVGVFIDTESLRSLPAAELRAGLAEVVKYGVILDADFFASLESNADSILRLDTAAMRHVVARCCRLKADVVEADEREVADRRAILNYGHTFAHAIESVTRAYRHGEAVAIGMIAASRLAERLGRVTPDVTERQRRLLERFGLPTQSPGLDRAALVAAMRPDKKAQAGRLRFVLPRRIGEVELVPDVSNQIVEQVVELMTGG
jgi:3-dehydroquinate synthase